MEIFDETTLRKLEQITLIAEHVRVGVLKGERRSRRRGSSIEFADYRNYAQGDDLRRLDWNVFARLERPFIKLLEEEEDLMIHLLVDISLSMDWPDHEGELNKLRYAVRLAAALGYIGLVAGDQLFVTLLCSNGNSNWGPFRGRQNALPLFKFLESAQASGITDLNLALRNYTHHGRRPGLLFVLSDLLSPAGYEDGLNALQSRGFEVGLIQLLSPDEITPGLSGDVKLIDIETGIDAEISLDLATVRAYRQRIIAWQQEIATFCSSRNVHYIPVTTDLPWERLVLQTFRARGIAK
jgi:uncharacterized protein (DUF58 family)